MNIFQPKDIIKPPLLSVLISSEIQLYKFFHPVVLYENYLIYIFMNIYETLVIREKILEKIRDVHIKLPMSHLPCVLAYQT